MITVVVLLSIQFQRASASDGVQAQQGYPPFAVPTTRFFRRFEFRFGFNNALRVFPGLLPPPGHRSLHRFWYFNIFHLYHFQFYSPRFRGNVHYLLQGFVDLFALLQYFIKLMLADNVSQCCDGELIHRFIEVLPLYYRLRGIDYFVPQHSIYFNRNTVFGNRFLSLKIHRSCSDIDKLLSFDDQDDQNQPGPLIPVNRPSLKTRDLSIFPERFESPAGILHDPRLPVKECVHSECMFIDTCATALVQDVPTYD